MPGSASKTLGIFAKYWQPGSVKTRLASEIGHDRAAALYASFVTTLLERLNELADSQYVVYSPPDRHDEFQKTVADTRWQTIPQTNGDLGERMNAFIRATLREGGGPVVIIGSDSPTLPLEFLHTAFDELRHRDVVLGPCTDGGYYLIGASRPIPEVFANIDWSTERVWPQTVDRIEKRGLEWASLPEFYDVDDTASLGRLDEELKESPADNMRQLRRQVQLAMEVANG